MGHLNTMWGKALAVAVPGGKNNQRLLGLAQANKAAELRTSEVGVQALDNTAENAVARDAIDHAIDDIKLGNLQFKGAKVPWIGPMKPFPFKAPTNPVSLAGDEITFAKNMNLNRGDHALAGLANVGAQRMAGSLAAETNSVASEVQAGLPQVLEAQTATAFGAGNATGVNALIGKVKAGPSQYYASVTGQPTPAWFDDMLTRLKSAQPAAAERSLGQEAAPQASALGSHPELAPGGYISEALQHGPIIDAASLRAATHTPAATSAAAVAPTPAAASASAPRAVTANNYNYLEELPSGIIVARQSPSAIKPQGGAFATGAERTHRSGVYHSPANVQAATEYLQAKQLGLA
jgi:hypothetical protein